MRHTIAHALISFLPVMGACTTDDPQGDDTGSSSGADTSGSTTAGTTTTATTATTTDGTDGTDGGSTDDASSGGGSDSGSTGGTAPLELEPVVVFDPAAFELPEGLAIDGGDALVGFAFTGAIERIALADGGRTVVATTPPPPPNTSFVTGITTDGEGQIYAAVVSFTAELAAGIYRAPAEGGDAVLWASDPAMVFPNGFAWSAADTLLVTDSVYGGVFEIDADGLATPWLQLAALEGDASNCGGTSDIAVGANGIARDGDALWVVGGDQGVVVRVPIEADGSAGVPETVAGPDCELAGLDGIVLDDDGSVIAAVNRSNRIVRVTADGDVAVLAEGPPLDFPASVAITDDGGERALVVTGFALGEFLAGGAPAPALLRAALP